MNIVWFKRDLRVEDHEPLFKACQAGEVIPLYIIEPELWQQPDTSWRHWYFIHDCLRDLDLSLSKLGANLIIKIGDSIRVFEDLRQQFGSFVLWSHEETGNNWTYQRDIAVSKWCKENAIVWNETPSNGVVRRLKSRDDWSKIRNARMQEKIVLVPNTLSFCHGILSDSLPPKDHVMFGGRTLGHVQEGGRLEAVKTLKSFLQERCKKYRYTMSKPGISARHCSRLSAHIAYGTLSVREVEQLTKKRIQDLEGDDSPESKNLRYNLTAFLSRLVWRCHFVQKLEQQPQIETECMHRAYEGMRESDFRDDYFEAWKYGKTGYPLIDACMRSLIENGWITFRMRAMLVSFASYHLWLDWRKTALYMAGLFTDYEPGIHYSQFQMQSGVTGINAVRIYNPIKQSMDHDPEGKFILRYLPELKNIPPIFIHEPWRYHDIEAHYQSPIVNHKEAIALARQKLSIVRQTDGFKETARATYKKLGSRNSPLKKSKKSPKNKNQMTFNFGEDEK